MSALVPAPAIAAGEDAFQTGLSAFRAGKYSTALDYFTRARRQGMDTAALHYNLGVVYYRLENYRAAAAAFERVRRYPAMAALASYNLGLVALRERRDADARRHFLAARDDAGDDKLRALAQSQIDDLDARSGARSRFIVDASAGVGYDDNLINADLQRYTTQGDNFAEFMFIGSGLLAGRWDQGLRLGLTAYTISYQEVDDYNMSLFNAGLLQTFPLSRWRTEVGVNAERSTLGGEDYLARRELVLGARRALASRWETLFHYRLDDYQSLNPEFDALEGSRRQFDAGLAWSPAPLYFNLRYRWEDNHRDDLREATAFTSYSPVRYGLSLLAALDFTPGWRGEIELDARDSHYHDPDTLPDGRVVSREDARRQVSLRLVRHLNRHWDLRGEYWYTDNDSNIDAYDYQRNVYSAALALIF